MFEGVWSSQFNCPYSYEETSLQLNDCTGSDTGSSLRYLGTCSGFNAVVIVWVGHSQSCYYDAQTNALVGAVGEDDIPMKICEYRSDNIKAGTIPAECPRTALTLLKICTPQENTGI